MQSPAGHEDPALAFGQHDEGRLGRYLRRNLLLGLGVDPAEIRHVELGPGLGRRVPLEQGLVLVPGLALGVHRAAVIDDPAVHRPGPGPVGVDPQAAGVFFVPAGHEVVLLVRAGIGPGIDPVAAGGGAVVGELGEVGHLLFVRHGVAVDLLGHQVDVGVVAVVPVELDDGVGTDRLGIGLIELLEFQPQPVGVPQVALGVPVGLHRLVAPLEPAAAVADAAFLLHGVRHGEEKDLGLDVLGLGPGPLPEDRGVRLPEVKGRQPFQLGQGLSRPGTGWGSSPPGSCPTPACP